MIYTFEWQINKEDIIGLIQNLLDYQYCSKEEYVVPKDWKKLVKQLPDEFLQWFWLFSCEMDIQNVGEYRSEDECDENFYQKGEWLCEMLGFERNKTDWQGQGDEAYEMEDEEETGELPFSKSF